MVGRYLERDSASAGLEDSELFRLLEDVSLDGREFDAVLVWDWSRLNWVCAGWPRSCVGFTSTAWSRCRSRSSRVSVYRTGRGRVDWHGGR